MSRGKKDREEITNTEEVKETEVSDEMEKAEDSEKSEDVKNLEETDDKPVSLYVQEPFIDPSVYRQRRKKRIIRTVTIAVVATLLAVYIGGVIFHMHRF